LTDILISAKLYKYLANHASELSQKVGRKVTVDEVANLSFKLGIDSPNFLEECVTALKVTMRKPPTPKPEATYAKRGEGFITLTPLFVVKKK